MPTVFLPISHAQATALRDGEVISGLNGCTATPALVATLGPGVNDDETAYAALSNAGVLALRGDAGEPRLLIAADVGPEHLVESGGPAGEVTVSGVGWAQVAALFADDAGAEPYLEAARLAVESLPLAAALLTPAVGELLDAVDLLWYDPAELDQLRAVGQAD